MINNTDKHLEFKISQEENNAIRYLDLSVNRTANNVEQNIYRKPTYIDITIHFTSNHPFHQKLAACIFYINRMTTMTIMEQEKKREWNKIIIMAQNNGLPEHIIHGSRKKLTTKIDRTKRTQAT